MRWLAPLAAALSLLGAASAPAQDVGPTDEEGGTIGRLEEDVQRARELDVLSAIRLRANSRFIPGSDFGEFKTDYYEPGGRLKITIPIGRSAAVRLLARGHVALYDFDDVQTDLFGTVSTGDPFDELYNTSLRIQGGYRVPSGLSLLHEDERWSILGEGFVKSRWEQGATFVDGIDGGGALAVGYQIGDWLELAIGPAIRTRMLRSGVRFAPVFELRWRFADRWQLASRGQGGELEYAFHEGLSAFVMGRIQSNSYRLADRGGAVGQGRMRHRQIPAVLGVRWDVLDSLRITASGGVLAYQSIKIQDENRETLSKVTADPAPHFELRFDVRP